MERSITQCRVYINFRLPLLFYRKLIKANYRWTRKSISLKSTWIPIVDSFPDQDVDIKLSDLIRYTVAKSDNNGCDALLSLFATVYLIKSLNLISTSWSGKLSTIGIQVLFRDMDFLVQR